MYATPTLRPVLVPTAQSMCCHITWTSKEGPSAEVTNPACAGRPFPTCRLDAVIAPSLCSASIPTSQGTLTISGT